MTTEQTQEAQQELRYTPPEGEDIDPDEAEETQGDAADAEAGENAADADDADDASEDEAEGEGEEEPEAEAKPRKRRNRSAQFRIRQLNARLREAEAENARLKAERPNGDARPAAQPTDDAEKPPRQDDFDDYGEYLEARAAHAARKAAREETASQREADEKRASEDRAKRQQDAASKRAAEFIEKGIEAYDDFEEVAFADDIPMTPIMRDAMLDSDDGWRVWYHLGNHPEEAERIAGLSPIGQAKAMGQIEAKVTAAPRKKASDAPAPIKPVGGGKKSSAKVDPDSLSMEDWLVWREKQLKAEGRR